MAVPLPPLPLLPPKLGTFVLFATTLIYLPFKVESLKPLASSTQSKSSNYM